MFEDSFVPLNINECTVMQCWVTAPNWSVSIDYLLV